MAASTAPTLSVRASTPFQVQSSMGHHEDLSSFTGKHTLLTNAKTPKKKKLAGITDETSSRPDTSPSRTGVTRTGRPRTTDSRGELLTNITFKGSVVWMEVVDRRLSCSQTAIGQTMARDPRAANGQPAEMMLARSANPPRVSPMDHGSHGCFHLLKTATML
jgi:hypothetical protein